MSREETPREPRMMWIASSWPCVVIRPTRAPFLWMSAFVPTVVPWVSTAISLQNCSNESPSRSAATRIAASMPSAKLPGVEGALVAVMRPERSSATQSVNVPPMSTPTSKFDARTVTPPPFLSEHGSVFVSGPTEKEEAMKPQTVGMIGLGIMGSAMSANLTRAGFRVAGFDVVPRRRAEDRRGGGIAARGPRGVARRSGIIVTSLPSADALVQVAADLLESAARGTILIETSTLPISVKEAACHALARRGVILLDCPLSGTGAQARVKDLIIYVSGDRAAYRKTVPVLQGFTRANYYVGAFGAGSKIKFVANLLVAIHNVTAAEAMVLGMRAGLDPALVLKVVSDGAGSSRMLQVRGPMMVKGDYSEATRSEERRVGKECRYEGTEN